MIPKKIHQIWTLGKNPPPLYEKKWIDSWSEKNPEWEYRLWTNKDFLEMSRNKFKDFFFLFENAKEIIKADIGRLLVLYEEGGVYADLDYECLRPIDDLFVSKKGLFLPTIKKMGYIHNAFFAGEKGNEFFLRLAYEGLKRWEENNFAKVEWIAGPDLFSEKASGYDFQDLSEEKVTPITWQKTAGYQERLAKRSSLSSEAYVVTYWSKGWAAAEGKKREPIVSEIDSERITVLSFFEKKFDEKGESFSSKNILNKEVWCKRKGYRFIAEEMVHTDDKHFSWLELEKIYNVLANEDSDFLFYLNKNSFISNLSLKASSIIGENYNFDVWAGLDVNGVSFTNVLFKNCDFVKKVLRETLDSFSEENGNENYTKALLKKLDENSGLSKLCILRNSILNSTEKSWSQSSSIIVFSDEENLENFFTEKNLKNIELKSVVQDIYLLPKISDDKKQLSKSGDGVVFLGDKNVVVDLFFSVRNIREKDDEIPIEIFYLGEDSVDKDFFNLFKEMNVVFKDITKSFPYLLNDIEIGGYSKLLHNVSAFMAKPCCLIESSFENVLYLDSDCSCLKKASSLFENKTFKENGVLLWSDMNEPRKPLIDLYREFGLKPRGLEVESGQILINTKKLFNSINVIEKLNKNSNIIYKYTWGDKDTYKLAFDLMNNPYWQGHFPIIKNGFFHKGCTEEDLWFWHRLSNCKIKNWKEFKENIIPRELDMEYTKESFRILKNKGYLNWENI